MIWALLHPIQEHAAEGEEAAQEGFNVGEVIIEHISNTSVEDPLIHLPKFLGIDFSVTKHVFMLWLVAFAVFAIVTFVVRRYIRQGGQVPSGLANVLEHVVLWIRDDIALPNVGKKWVNTWTPFILTFFVFIFSANLIGMIPIFEVLAVLDHYVFDFRHESFFGKVIHGGTTATANYNVTAGLAMITFGAIIAAGSRAHGVVNHFKNMVPHGLAWPVYIILWPIEILGMFVKPFALTMRLAANMTGGHIALLAVMSLVFIFTEMFKTALAGVAVGLVVSVPLAVGISALELIVVLVQAYVFTLLSAVFIGMAIHVHH
jgi:F-type H+-transporting ATPase subunit a